MQTTTLAPRSPALPHIVIKPALVVGFALLTALCAQIQIPLPGGVPMTLQTLAVATCALCIGGSLGTMSMMLYVMMGVAGFGVFANGSGGVDVVFDATGGYILGFILSQPVAGALTRRWRDASGRLTWNRMCLIALAVHAIIFAIGVPWLKIATGMQVTSALFHGCVIFIPGMAIKILASSQIASVTGQARE
ncbi:MAG: biotin transporter BioY [Phycisphaeraceae bacterium]|nr:biotin transporter BioY [Phycisphaerales bacterium]MCB9860075.1 biotin transporter BioY [Phycisphaeraceae bacterium]